MGCKGKSVVRMDLTPMDALAVSCRIDRTTQASRGRMKAGLAPAEQALAGRAKAGTGNTAALESEYCDDDSVAGRGDRCPSYMNFAEADFGNSLAVAAACSDFVEMLRLDWRRQSLAL